MPEASITYLWRLSKARHFQIIDGKLMPSLSSIDGLGEKAADAVVDAVKDGAFLSIEDFSNRSKVNPLLEKQHTNPLSFSIVRTEQKNKLHPALILEAFTSVSYTHLDVYKRQTMYGVI